ncbi:MAG TPA: IS1595 family transposase [Actinomycetes bacterium]|nr:IS1595 family transposase [Actinomycetes bacterium]
MLQQIPIPRAPGNPVAGQDYPRTWQEFVAFFPDERACASYLERLSWPDGFLCSRCGWGGEPWRGSRRRLVCRSCGHETTVTAGTLFQGTRTPLRQWLEAAWQVSTADEGISARHLQRALGLGSYETAWAILHRLRRAMVRSGRPRLDGVVEVGRTVLPARLAPEARGHAADRGRRRPRAVVAIAVEDRDHEAGRVRMQRLASSSDRHLVRFIGWAVEPRTLVRAAGLRDPAILVRLGWPAERVRALDAVAQAGRGQPGGGLPGPGLPHLREVERRLTRWLLATHQGAVSSGLLDWYLDEFTFRFNRRSARHRGLLFYRLLEEALVTPPQPYGTVVGGSEQIGRTARRSRVR